MSQSRKSYKEGFSYNNVPQNRIKTYFVPTTRSMGSKWVRDGPTSKLEKSVKWI